MNINTERPQSGKAVLVVMKDGAIHEGHYIKNANKYVRNVDRWRIYRLGNKTIPSDEVQGWVNIPAVDTDPYMTRDDILNDLSDCINECDGAGLIGAGDKLLSVITALKMEWDIPLDE